MPTRFWDITLAVSSNHASTREELERQYPSDAQPHFPADPWGLQSNPIAFWLVGQEMFPAAQMAPGSHDPLATRHVSPV